MHSFMILLFILCVRNTHPLRIGNECENDDVIPNPSRCGPYMMCIDNQWVRTECPVGAGHHQDGRCFPGFCFPNKTEDNVCTEGTILQNGVNKHGYLRCENNQWMSYMCWHPPTTETLKDPEKYEHEITSFQCTYYRCWGLKFVHPETSEDYWNQPDKTSVGYNEDGSGIHPCRHVTTSDTNLLSYSFGRGHTSETDRPACLIPMDKTEPERKNSYSNTDYFQILTNPLNLELRWIRSDTPPSEEVGPFSGISSKLNMTYLIRCRNTSNPEEQWVTGEYRESRGGEVLKAAVFVSVRNDSKGDKHAEVKSCEPGQIEFMGCPLKRPKIFDGHSCAGYPSNATGENYGDDAGYFICLNGIWDRVACEIGSKHMGAGICMNPAGVITPGLHKHREYEGQLWDSSRPCQGLFWQKRPRLPKIQWNKDEKNPQVQPIYICRHFYKDHWHHGVFVNNTCVAIHKSSTEPFYIAKNFTTNLAFLVAAKEDSYQWVNQHPIKFVNGVVGTYSGTDPESTRKHEVYQICRDWHRSRYQPTFCHAAENYGWYFMLKNDGKEYDKYPSDYDNNINTLYVLHCKQK